MTVLVVPLLYSDLIPFHSHVSKSRIGVLKFYRVNVFSSGLKVLRSSRLNRRSNLALISR
jgi:hypothetical protein